MRERIAVLLSSVGRRSQLVECFREALSELGIEGSVFGTDATPERAPAAQLVDKCFRVPRCTSPEFIDAMLEICRENGISLLVPTIDTELPVLAKNRVLFQDAGVSAVISGEKTVAIACDKWETHRWLTSRGFPTVKQASAPEVLRADSYFKFPVIAKPVNGSASIGVRMVTSPQMLELVHRDAPELIVQECAEGREHTVNVFVNGEGKCVCAVPHLRVETRGGEVSKGITVMHRPMMEMAASVAEILPDAYGPLNIQCFLAPDGSIHIIELNARFGGGFPLASKAGAKFARWLLEEHLGLKSSAEFWGWRDGLLMLRYDSAVFVETK